MNTNLSPSQKHLVRDTFNRINVVNSALDLAESHSETNDRTAAVILMCRRALSSICNDIPDTFGSDWPENQQ